MSPQPLADRVDSLEKRVSLLERIPARLDSLESQIVLLRTEMREEFSAIRTEFLARDNESLGALREEIRTGDEETRRVLREEIHAGDEETRRVLRDEIRGGDEETRRFMRVLHEEVLERIARIGEGTAPRGRSRRPKGPQSGD
jgi:hypothetical protein